jgi:hypothetical protein
MLFASFLPIHPGKLSTETSGISVDPIGTSPLQETIYEILSSFQTIAFATEKIASTMLVIVG